MGKQFKRILIPLDGSKLAEVAIDNAVGIAELSGSELVLLRILRPINDIIKNGRNLFYIDEQVDNRTIRANEYLNSLRDEIKGPSFKIKTVVEMGLAENIIIDYANDNHVDLIVMATHGRTGLKQWVYGSVARKVLNAAHNPVMLCRSFPDK